MTTETPAHKKHKEKTLEAQAANYIFEMAKPFAVIAGAVLILGAGYYGYKHFAATQETKAQEELYTLQKNVDDKEKKIEKEAEDKVKGKADFGKLKKLDTKKLEEMMAKAEVVKDQKSLAANFADDLNNYEKFIQSHNGKKAALMAAIQGAKLASDYKDFARAEKILRLANAGVENTDMFAGLVRAQLSTALIGQSKYSEAIGELTKITDSPKLSFFHAHALLHLAACFLETKDFEKAQSALTRIEKDFGNTQAASEAKQLKRLLLLKKSNKEAKT